VKLSTTPGKVDGSGLYRGRDRVIIALLFISALLNFVDRGNLSVAAPVLGPEFGLTPVAMGVLLSAFFWTYSVFQVLTGWLADRYQASLLYGAGFLIWSIATMLTGVVHSFTGLVIFRLLLGLGESTAFPAISSILATNFPEDRRGFVNSLIDAAGKSGPAVGTFFGALIISAYGWRNLFLWVGSASLLWLIPWARFAPRQPAAAHEREFAPGFLQILSKRAAWATFFGLFSLNYGYFFLITWLPSYLVRERHFSMRSMAVFGALPFAAAALSSVVSGWTSDRLIARGHSVNAVRKSFAAGGAFLSAFPLFASALSRDAIAMPLLALSFLAIGMFTSNLWTITITLAGKSAAGRWTGMQNAFGNLGSLIAPIVTGWIVGHTGSFLLAFAAASGYMLLGCAMYLFGIKKIEPVQWRTRYDVASSA
jgi:MFS family permease